MTSTGNTTPAGSRTASQAPGKDALASDLHQEDPSVLRLFAQEGAGA